jgi:hypothetical protein
MIRYALSCDEGHPFEAWFASSDAYDAQSAARLVECPMCGSMKVRKQIMAPHVASSTRRRGEGESGRRGTESASTDAGSEASSAATDASEGSHGGSEDQPPGRSHGSSHDQSGGRQGLSLSPSEFAELAAKVRAHIRQTHAYVGEKFAEEARAMHAGQKDEKPIFGEATLAEARALQEEGVPVAALPEEFAPVVGKKVN